MNHEQQVAWMRSFIEEEIQVAIKGLNAEGAPSPNGILVPFYREFWELVRGEVMATLEEFWQGTDSTEKINKSHLFLLPKCQDAIIVEEFRHMSQSISVYLIICKSASK